MSEFPFAPVTLPTENTSLAGIVLFQKPSPLALPAPRFKNKLYCPELVPSFKSLWNTHQFWDSSLFLSNTNSGAVVSTKEKNADDLPF